VANLRPISRLIVNILLRDSSCSGALQASRSIFSCQGERHIGRGLIAPVKNWQHLRLAIDHHRDRATACSDIDTTDRHQTLPRSHSDISDGRRCRILVLGERRQLEIKARLRGDSSHTARTPYLLRLHVSSSGLRRLDYAPVCRLDDLPKQPQRRQGGGVSRRLRLQTTHLTRLLAGPCP
jgi:hypothetical protein